MSHDDDPDEPDAPYHEGWRLLPHAPLVRRHGHATVWTGTHLVVWGGVRTDERHHGTGLTYLRSGASYDPATRRWWRLPPSPLDGRLGQVAVAADGEMIIWGGRRDEADPAGAAYDPTERRWRLLAAGPADSANPRGAAWTGRFVVVWGAEGDAFVAAAYEPREDRWHELPPLPFAAGDSTEAVWVDDQLLVWSPPEPGSRFALLAAWQPLEERWRLRRPVAFAGGPPRLLAAGDRVLAWGGEPGEAWAYSYHLPSGQRQAVPPPPVDPRDELVSAFDGSRLITWSARENRTFVLDPVSGEAESLPDSPLAPRAGTGGALSPGGLVVWGGASPARHYNDGAVLDAGVSMTP